MEKMRFRLGIITIAFALAFALGFALVVSAARGQTRHQIEAEMITHVITPCAEAMLRGVGQSHTPEAVEALVGMWQLVVADDFAASVDEIHALASETPSMRRLAARMQLYPVLATGCIDGALQR